MNPLDAGLLQTMQADAVAARLLHLLEDAQVPAILLKGSALAELYPERHRHYVDVDVLVRDSALPVVMGMLRELGYAEHLPGVRAVERTAHATTWVHPRLPSVDVHTTIPGVGVGASAMWEVLDRHCEPHVVAGQRCRRLDRPTRALHVGLHAAQSGIAHQKVMEDLVRGIVWFDFGLWQGAAQVADELDAVGAFSAGLMLVPSGEALAERLGILSAPSSVETRLQAAAAARGAVSVARLAAIPTVAGRLRYALGRLFPSADLLRVEEPIARRGGRWLAVAYAARVVHVLRRLPPAITDYRRARGG